MVVLWIGDSEDDNIFVVVVVVGVKKCPGKGFMDVFFFLPYYYLFNLT